MSRGLQKLGWQKWTPGLDCNDECAGEFLDTLPGANPDEIPWIVRLLENPDSPIGLPGSIHLHDHDIIHILLGRGLSVQDEAFVIGFTMGHDPRSFRFGNWWASFLKNFFLKLSDWTYPKHYAFDEQEKQIFRRAFWEGRKAYARQMKTSDASQQTLCKANLYEQRQTKIGELRRRFGISVERLRVCYRKEILEYPDRQVSRRLDICVQTDYIDIVPPNGEDSNWKKER